jgi:methionine-S-sulfoxide reductase
MKFILVLLVAQFAMSAPLYKTAVFAGGCFWCMEPPFDKADGVTKTISGYSGGEKNNPNYHEVASGRTNHIEAIEVTYDASKITYEQLLDIFWRQVDPTDPGGQFVDRGHQYSTAIFYKTEAEKKIALKSMAKIQKNFKKKIVTKVRAYSKFFPAEDYHQDYYKKNPIRYKFYRYNSGRDQFLKKVWK